MTAHTFDDALRLRRTTSICIHITPPVTTNEGLLSGYNECFSPAVLGRDSAGAQCTSYGVMQTARAVENEVSLPPALDAVIDVIKRSNDECLQFALKGDPKAVEGCLVFAHPLLFSF